MRISDWSADVCSSDLLVAANENNPGANSRGFRIDNYPQIRAMFHATLEKALSGNQPAPTALKTAAAEAGKLMGKIGRASCRERVCQYVEISVVAGSLKKKRGERRRGRDIVRAR